MKHKKAFGIALAFAACLGVAAPSFSPIAEAAMKLESSEHWVRVEFDALPQTAAEVAPCQTPEETAALTVAALVRFTEDQETGIAMLNVLRGPRPLSPQEIQLLKDQLLKDRDYVARSHFNGATPDNNYTPLQPYSVTVADSVHSYDQENYATLYIRSGGADSPRPITLRKKPSTGEWFLWNHVGLLPGIRVPASQDPWR
ncbi:MAG: hypothetical protein II880_04635 [Schwartzia sp.]|nr:hypothetical protein [Schwartzia sp. (in: firmicutes)]